MDKVEKKETDIVNIINSYLNMPIEYDPNSVYLVNVISNLIIDEKPNRDNKEIEKPIKE